MNPRYAKSIITRTKRLSAQFEGENGRTPTIAELNSLYKAEMANMGAKSNRKTPRGFAKIDPDKALEIRRMGGHARKGTKNKKAQP